MRIKAVILAMLLLLLSQAALSPAEEFYSSFGSFGGDWTNNPSNATQSPDDKVAWELLDANKTLYTFGYQGLPSSGLINEVYLGLRSNFSAPSSGDDVLLLKYSLDNVVWRNLDGSAFDGSSISNQSLALNTEYYTIAQELSWQELSSIYLGVEGRRVGSADSEISGIDSIWLGVDYTDIEPPLIWLMGPEEGNLSTSADIAFRFNVSDALSQIKNCSLILDDSQNATNSSVSEDVEQTFVVLGLADGSHSWSVNCTDDSSGHNTNSSQTRNFTVDTAGPVIWLESPLGGMEWNTTPTVRFEYNTSDVVGNVSSCFLVIDGQMIGSADSPIEEGTGQSFETEIANGAYDWSINCTDSSGIMANSSTFSLEVDVHYPTVESISVENPINLMVASTIELTCNATIQHEKGVWLISEVSGTIYDGGYYALSPDDKNNHYTDPSCSQLSASGNYANYSCSFVVYYFANPGDWRCNISAEDINGLAGSKEENFSINSLYGLSISPNYINYSSLHVGENSSTDTNITITNFGNVEVDITLYGYASSSGDGLAMGCTYGNISVEKEKYSLVAGTSYSGMSPLTPRAMQIDSFNLPKTDSELSNSTKKVYWKIGVPYGVSGNCTGNIVIGAVQS